MKHAWFALVLLALTVEAQEPQGAAAVRESYTKYELEIPVRDGVKLFTSVYVPKDTSRDYPIMLLRTPYSVSPYGVDHYRSSVGPSELFQESGYIFAYQDVRGRYMSEGTWQEVRPHRPEKSGSKDIDESTDTWDTIDWLVKNIPGNNGKVGMWGISYPGFYVSAGMIDAHPALAAASPQAPVTDNFLGDDAYHNGAFMLAANFGFYQFFIERKGGPSPPQPRLRFDYGTPDGYDFLLRMGPLGNANEKYFKYGNPYWDEYSENTIAGPVNVSLMVSTTGTDSDFVVKLIDVYPGNYPDYEPTDRDQQPANAVKMGGYQQLVRGEPFRGKFRKSFEKPVPFEPGVSDRIEFSMPAVGHTFRKGHRIMVQVQSSWFPLTDRNPQKFVEIPNATADDFQKATQRVYRGGPQGSRLTLRVLPSSF